MKRIAIITINSMNFGNRLQNYALQQVLSSLGFSVETIKRDYYPLNIHDRFDNILDPLRVLMRTRKGLYIQFDKNNIKYSKYISSPNEIDPNVNCDYDMFISGSDQVWNPHYEAYVGDVDLLLFTNGEKRISYAASFGVESIPEEKKNKYIQALSEYKAISVREEAGAKLVHSLIGKNVPVVLDPTFLLEKKEWAKVSKKPKKAPHKPYILVYALGKRSELMEKAISKYVSEKHFEVFDILRKNIRGREFYAGPSEFLWLIQNAEMVLTDSFHASVFSIIFQVSVMTFPRNGMDMSSRIINLAKSLGLNDCFDGEKVFSYDNRNNQIVKSNISSQKELSIIFLKNALL